MPGDELLGALEEELRFRMYSPRTINQKVRELSETFIRIIGVSQNFQFSLPKGKETRTTKRNGAWLRLITERRCR